MSISEKLGDAKRALAELKKNHRYKKANAAMAQNIELQMALGKCRGRLEVCLRDFNRIIQTQSKNIAEGRRGGFDTIIQEQQLWDAAIGYMLVKDAIFALKTIGNHDAIANAYEMLDAAVNQMSGKGSKLRHMPQIGILRDRGIYKKLTSQEAIQEKEQLLDAFFETLKETGNIEGCLSGMEHPGATEATRRAGAVSTSATDLHDRLNSIPGDAEEPEISAERIKEMSDF